ncbi:hypothetical protein MCOR18_005691, partial [Pyricularia oryzae]
SIWLDTPPRSLSSVESQGITVMLMLPDIRVASDKDVAACMDQVALADRTPPTSLTGTCCSTTWPDFVDSHKIHAMLQAVCGRSTWPVSSSLTGVTPSSIILCACYRPEYAESKETLGPMTIGGCQSKEYDIVFLEMGTNRYTGLDFIEYELNIVKP